MGGFWVTLYNNLAQTKIAGYLYSCNVCNHVIRVKTKTEKQNCPKCGEAIAEVS